MVVKELVLLLGALFNCCFGAIYFAYELFPYDNCSNAYINILEKNFSCESHGTNYLVNYCSRGYADDIYTVCQNVGSVFPEC